MSRTRSLSFMVAVTFAAASLLSQQTSGDEGFTTVRVTKQLDSRFSNGKSWKAVDMQSRIMWVQGIQEGMGFLVREVYPHTSVADRAMIENEFLASMVQGFRNSDVVKQIDEFYEDSSNLRIPVVDAYKYTVKKMQGAKQRELDDYGAHLRQLYNR